MSWVVGKESGCMKCVSTQVIELCSLTWGTITFSFLECEFQIELHAAWGLGLVGLAEACKWDWAGAKNATERGVVFLVEDVEGIQRGGELGAFFFARAQVERMTKVQIDVEVAWTVQRVARPPRSSINDQAVVVVVITGGLVHWQAGVSGECDSEAEELFRLECA